MIFESNLHVLYRINVISPVNPLFCIQHHLQVKKFKLSNSSVDDQSIFSSSYVFLLSDHVLSIKIQKSLNVFVDFLFRIRMEHLAAITQEEANSLRKKEVAGKQLVL